MYIHRIKIVNFRNFANFEVRFASRKNIVIVGENNAGKTNLLYALRLVLDATLPNSARYLEASDFWQGLDRPFAGHKIEITVDFADFLSSSSESSPLASCLEQDDGEVISSISYVYCPKLGLDTGDTTHLTRDDYEVIFCCNGQVENRITDLSFQRFIPFVLLPALRDASSDLESWRRSPLSKLIERLEVDKAELDALGQEIDEAIEKIIALDPIANLEAEIQTRLGDMIGHTNIVDPNLGFLPTDSERLLRFLRLFAEGRYKRNLDEIGSGYANILYLVLLLLDAHQREKAVEQATMVLAVEEPEAHLHPHLQRLVFSDIFNSGSIHLEEGIAQERGYSLPVLITTHSPHIASVAPLESILSLQLTEDGTRGRNIASAGLSETEIADIERYIDSTKAELVFAKGIILVEGIVEVIFINELAKKLDRSLDEAGISVISVNGTDFAPYVRLLGKHGLDIRTAIITDGDPANGEMSGLARGRKLLELIAPTFLEEHILPEDDQAVRQALKDVGVFVGHHTIEIDLIDTGYSEEILLTFEELGEGQQSIQNTSDLFENWDSIDYSDKENGLIKKIERICGKGRFAQRFAPKMDLDRIPESIEDSLMYMGLL